MSKTRRRTTICNNCDTPLVNQENFCPQCGQENHMKQVSIKELATDFADDYIGFDNKMVRSFWPLFFRPGQMTKEFLDGKRKKFIRPVRIFLFMSFIYFGVSLLLSSGDGNITFNDQAPSGEKGEAFLDAFHGNMNLLVFFFTPLAALFTKWMFRTEKRKYYVSFFVFALHYMAFIFAFTTVLVLIDWIVPEETQQIQWVNNTLLSVYITALVLMIVYGINATKTVFEKKYNAFLFIVLLLMCVLAFMILWVGFAVLLGWFYGMFSS